MKITRDGKEYELTFEELTQANQEFVTSFMQKTLESDFGILAEHSEEVAKKAFQHYEMGNGKTEYECIEWAAEQFSELPEK